MTCPVCGGKTTVYVSATDCECVYRGRKCLECGYKFNTVEAESNEKFSVYRIILENKNRGK